MLLEEQRAKLSTVFKKVQELKETEQVHTPAYAEAYQEMGKLFAIVKDLERQKNEIVGNQILNQATLP